MERPQGHAVSLARIDLLEKDFLAFRACNQTLSRTVSTPESVREVDSRVSVVFVGAGHAFDGGLLRQEWTNAGKQKTRGHAPCDCSHGLRLKQEVTFDKSKVTSTNWTRYKMLTMEETREIKVVQISRDDKGFGGGSEAANALDPPAVAATFFDATGVHARRVPLTPAYVTTLLKARSRTP